MRTMRAGMLVRQWRERFRKDALAASVIVDLRGRSAEIWRRAFELMQRESPEYRNSVDDEFAQELKTHCGELLKTIVAIADGRAKELGTDPFDFVRTHAEWRARHHVPLLASLDAYRLAHRIYWEITRETLLRHSHPKTAMPSLATLSDFWIELFDYVGAVLAQAHAVEDGLVAAQGTQTYVDLIDDLLRGLHPRDPQAQRLCAMCGIRSGASMAVLVARPRSSENGAPIDLEVTLRSLVRLIEQVLPAASFGKLIDIRNDEVTAIICSKTDTARTLVQALRRHAFLRRAPARPAPRIGVGLDTSEIPQLPRSLEEARLALEFATTEQPLMHFGDIDVLELLVQRADRAAFRLIPDWARHFHPTSDGQSREMLRTIRTFADCNFNVKKTARGLGVHTNTVYFRLNRVKKLTNIDPRTYSGISHLLTVLRLHQLGSAPRNGS